MSNSTPIAIRLRGIRQNNLKNLDLDIPLGKLIVVTGLSGAGKSSLVFETLHAEGQRRYVETFSPYARQFMEMMDRPQVDSIENIRPSIAIEQRNTVRNSRSTVGTMTELTDFMKVWFSHIADIFDPETGEKIEDDNPESIWAKSLERFPNQSALITFRILKAGKLRWNAILESIASQGYTRLIHNHSLLRTEDIDPQSLQDSDALFVIQDRITLTPKNQNRFLESIRTALHFGQGEIHLFDQQSQALDHFSEGLHTPGTDRRYRPATPNLFSFNSPLGACDRCRGFGRVIETDYNLVIPDPSLSIAAGAIRAFQGAVYSESQRDLIRACKKLKIPTDKPWGQMTDAQRQRVIEGDPNYEKKGGSQSKLWYGVRRFFDWLESNTYKMHVRVFLSKYRSYTTCPLCLGSRLQPEALLWKWMGFSLPDLYDLPISDLRSRLAPSLKPSGDKRLDLASEAILTRLQYLEQVGLGYLTLNRSSRTLSGGETQRVNLTSCLGTSLVDTLFILDEPSIGLHSRDINRLIQILKTLTAQGNTVIVVEHDEAIMRAADQILEIGPEPGALGGYCTFQGSLPDLLLDSNSITGAYLSSRENIPLPRLRRPVHPRNYTDWLRIKGASKHNLHNLDLAIPLQRLVALSGVSGSGKSTVLNNVLFQGLNLNSGRASEDPAAIAEIDCPLGFSEIVLVDQSPASRTPRSSPVLFVDAWDSIRQLFAQTDQAQSAGLTISHFSFNSGTGRCDHCEGLGHERIEMQFMADVYIVCPICEGKRFRPEILEIEWNGKNIAELLQLSVDEAALFFRQSPKIAHRLQYLIDVGLGYVSLGQPLNTLSGGESQRLKLVKFLAAFEKNHDHALILLDEPTTGLHRHDIRRLLEVLQRLVNAGHSLVIIEHQLDVLKSADWLIEMGPEAGSEGGKITFAGPPNQIDASASATAPFLLEALNPHSPLIAAEASADYNCNQFTDTPARIPSLRIQGARENNLRDISLDIPHNQMTVVTGVSGSGKSTLAFDIVFAEGQRRFMESMSPWARQYIEQLPRPDIDSLSGIPPTVAIEQRVTRGSRKSTVATITEVAQYLRLLFARIGIQHNPANDQPLVTLSKTALVHNFESHLKQLQKKGQVLSYLCAPLVRGRKGHHQPIANWAIAQGYSHLRIDGAIVPLSAFEKLDRYNEHDIELIVATCTHPTNKRKISLTSRGLPITAATLIDLAMKLGKGASFLADPIGRHLAWFSSANTDPTTGESFPSLDPKNFSWNSARGWCPSCRGHGLLYDWMLKDEAFDALPAHFHDAATCPSCQGARLNPISRAVFLHLKKAEPVNLPQLLAFPPSHLLNALQQLDLDRRGKAILKDLLPEIEERLKFMNEVGLGYLTLDRATDTLSGGEAQRIRLAAQLGSNLSGVLYVLDEPSIGLHARDNDRLLKSLANLKAKGNTLLIVEHNAETMRAADSIIDLGPGAGLHGGSILAHGTLPQLLKTKASLTGQYLKCGIQHPLRGAYRPLPKPYSPRRKSAAKDWLVLEEPSLRNLKGGTLSIPKARLTAVCGISGAGKSTLIRHLLHPAVAHAIKAKSDLLKPSDVCPLPFKVLRHADVFRSIIEVDQSPIGKTPRSTPATYIGAFDIIRQFFGQINEAKMRGYNASTFSFNTKGGRCETCKGAGRIKLEMNFMPDAYVHCDHCDGKRYSSDILDLRWNDKNIADILRMSFEEAAEFFHFHSRLHAILKLMVETGLGYLTLGQSSPTLSGGEAQRLKLVSELTKGLPSYQDRKRGIIQSNLYILEEPTIGLHLSDCERLLELLHRLVDQGHTVLVIEHHLDLIADADYVIEIGPDGGENGGHILHQGNVTNLLKSKTSPTAPFLKDLLKCQK